MSKRHYTSTQTLVNAEYIRKGAYGLELVKIVAGVLSIIPIRTTVRKEGRRLVIGAEPRPVEPRFVNGNLEVF